MRELLALSHTPSATAIIVPVAALFVESTAEIEFAPIVPT